MLKHDKNIDISDFTVYEDRRTTNLLLRVLKVLKFSIFKGYQEKPRSDDTLSFFNQYNFMIILCYEFVVSV